ncbi:MAG: hypothetical protein ABID09_04170 [Candidatus Omnitrophota bacterium]
MKLLLFKNIASHNTRRKIYSMSETVNKDGMQITTQKYWIYRIEERVHLNRLHPFRDTDRLPVRCDMKKRRFDIIKKHDSGKCEVKVLCRMRAPLNILKEGYLYRIALTELLKVSLKPLETHLKK